MRFDGSNPEEYVIRAWNLPCGRIVRRAIPQDYENETHKKSRCKRRREPMDEETLNKLKAAKARWTRHRKKKSKELLSATNEMENLEIIDNFFQRNRAVQTHLMYFSLLSYLAIENKWRIGYGMYRKRMKADEVIKTQAKVKRWVQNHGKEVMGAVSIGWGKNGYIYIYTVCTSENELAVFDFNTDLAQYLRKNKYTPIECRPFEKDPYGFLDGHYCKELTKDTDLTELQVTELAYMIRSSFLLYDKYKTIRTKKASDAMEDSVEIEPDDKGRTMTEQTLLMDGVGFMEGWGRDDDELYEEEPYDPDSDAEF